MAASAPYHNPSLFDLYFAHSTSSLFKRTTTAAVGGIASWVAMGVIAVTGSWNSRVISSSVDGRSVAQPVGWREQVLGTDLRSCAVRTLSLLLPTFPHTNFLYGESHVRAPEQKIVPRPDQTGPTLFRAKTVPETVPVLSLMCGTVMPINLWCVVICGFQADRIGLIIDYSIGFEFWIKTSTTSLLFTCISLRGKSSESVQCAITGPCLRMHHRHSA